MGEFIVALLLRREWAIQPRCGVGYLMSIFFTVVLIV